MASTFLPLTQLKTLLSFLLSSELLNSVKAIRHLVQHMPLFQRQQGLYEVLAHEACLELKDAQGHVAVYSKRQQVKFLQDNIIAYQDKAWGDGDIFAQYRCSPGIAVDRYREGHRYRILISLREAKKRGDEETFQIERTIHDGFSKATEDLQTEIDHRTRQAAVSVIFPVERPPRQALLIEQNAQRTTPLPQQQWLRLPDGRIQVQWQDDHPHLFEAYILRWTW